MRVERLELTNFRGIRHLELAVALLQEGASDAEIRQFIAFIDSRNSGGQHIPFASAIVHFLSTYL